jgi:diguanylate cyclase (GGDEF)-like protein
MVTVAKGYVPVKGISGKRDRSYTSGDNSKGNWLTTTMRDYSPNIKLAILACSLLAVVIVSLMSYYTGDFSLEVVYALVIMLSSWYAGRVQGLIVTVISGAGIVLSYFVFNTQSVAMHYVNKGLEIVVLTTISLLTSALRDHYLKAKYIASYDSLTGVSNRNSFFLLAQQILLEASRYKRPFSLAFFDLDNFKQVNDRNGHLEGDRALQIVADTIRSNLRQADIVARFGGDEFVILLPETDHAMAESVLRKLRSNLLDAMQDNNWPITFSIGAVTCNNFHFSIDDLLQLADNYLYSVKSLRKNDLRIEKV